MLDERTEFNESSQGLRGCFLVEYSPGSHQSSSSAKRRHKYRIKVQLLHSRTTHTQSSEFI